MSGPEPEIRELLGRAIGPEPPLALDRAEVIRRGRRAVRARRIATSGGVAASVIAVVVGAALLTDLAGDTGRQAGPARAGGPTGATVATSTGPPSTQLDPEQHRAHAAALSSALADVNVLPVDGVSPVAFTYAHGTYLAGTDLVDGRGGGSLRIEIRQAGAATEPVHCENSTRQVRVECRIASDGDYPTSVTTRMSDTGLIEYVVRAVRPDGTDIMITASNLAANNPAGAAVTRYKPVVGHAVLERLAKSPRLSYR